MKQSKLLRGTTLTAFFLFIAVFVLYRAGKFDSYLRTGTSVQTDPNGGNINNGGKDTLPKDINASSQKVSMPSSKYVVLTDTSKPHIRVDSVATKQRRAMLSSSKSTTMLTIDDSSLFRLNPGIFKADTLNNKKTRQ